MGARVIAKLVTAGHEDLAEQLLRAMPGSAPARIEDGEVKLPMYRGFDDQSPRRAVAAKKLMADDDMVQVPGFGKMKLGQLKKQVITKAEDLAKRAKQGQFQTIAESNLDVFGSMWKVLHDLQRSGRI